MKLKKDIERFCITQDATIMDTMKVINDADERACFMVDDQMRLLKVFTDGDIRRALIGGYKLDDFIKDIHQHEPFVIKEGQNIDEARHYLSKRITVVPVVNQQNQVKGLIRMHDVEPFLNIKSREILVLGMGYVGLTLAIILADEGFTVHGYDTNKDLIKNIKEKKMPFYERGMEKYLSKHVSKNLNLLDSIEKVSADIYIITVGTPIDKVTMKPNDSFISQAAKAIGSILKKNDLVILRSTVPVGLTRKTVLPILENESGLKVGDDFYLAYCPERTAEGKALEELRKNPQIVGGYDARSIELASRLFNENTHTVIDVGSLEAAELCKLMDNTYRDTIFAYSNQMALLAEKLGLNLGHLIDMVNIQYQRNLIPKPSPGVGGACLSKDPYILIKNFEEHNIDGSFIKCARAINEAAPKNIYARSTSLMSTVQKELQTSKIFIIGFAFKGEPETSDLRESTTLWFLEELKWNNVKNIWGYDPIVQAQQIKALGIKACTIEEGFKGADAVFIMNNHKSYVNLGIFDLLETMNKPSLFYDGWQNFSPLDIKNIPGIIYSGIGIG
ncbi:MAG: nucleotide sugar dehydrogenase [Candidatus Omnitrophica bacterium]|nr:nucleotide sugar dehydrogenase [Candidatus Omnitrophota bacterium]